MYRPAVAVGASTHTPRGTRETARSHNTGCSYLLRLWQLVRDMDEHINEYMNGGMNQRQERKGQRKRMASQDKRQEKRCRKKCAANKSLWLPWEVRPCTPVPGEASLLIK